MAELKTKKNKASVSAFLNSITDDQQRKDAKTVAKIMREVTGAKATMWGDNIVGFGQYDYKYASGHEGSWPLTGFSPRKGNLSVYIMSGFKGRATLLKKLGKHKKGKACLNIKRLEDVDLGILRRLIAASVKGKAKSSA
ncbi:MAG: DUF1801 domain-containing protein [Planctomycetota bacterium]|jgi:hypothetical protein